MSHRDRGIADLFSLRRWYVPFQRKRGGETFDERQGRGTGTRPPALCARVLRPEYQALTRGVPDPRSLDEEVLFFSPRTWGSVTRNWLRGFRPRNVDDARRAGYVMLRREGDFILRLSTRAPIVPPAWTAPSARRVTGSSLLLFVFFFLLFVCFPPPSLAASPYVAARVLVIT